MSDMQTQVHSLSDAARIQFTEALGKEIKKDIESKTGYFAVPAGILAFGLLGRIAPAHRR